MANLSDQDYLEAEHRVAEERAQWREEQMKELRFKSRASLPFGLRLPLATGMAFLAGMGLGLSYGSKTSGFRFRAENAHRLPTSSTGWYLYHKSKNYYMAMGGVKEGIKMGAKLSFWTVGFFSIEEMFDRYRGTKDFFNTVIASLAMTGGFSLWNRFPIQTAAKTAKTGLAIGLVYGIAQDGLAVAKGRNPGYVDLIFGFGRGQQHTS